MSMRVLCDPSWKFQQRCPSYHSRQYCFLHHYIRRALRPAQLGLSCRQFPSYTMGSFLVSKFLQGLSNFTIAHDVQLPITSAILYRMLHALSVMRFSLYKTALLMALYLTMFHGFLRVGEATSKSSASSPIQ